MVYCYDFLSLIDVSRGNKTLTSLTLMKEVFFSAVVYGSKELEMS